RRETTAHRPADERRDSGQPGARLGLDDHDELKPCLQSIHSILPALMTISAMGVPATARSLARLRRLSTSSSRPSLPKNHSPRRTMRAVNNGRLNYENIDWLSTR